MKTRNLTVGDQMGLNSCLSFTEKTVFATSANDSEIGAILVIPFSDIKQVYRDEEGESLFFDVKTTEGDQTYEVFDFLVVDFSQVKK